MDKRKFFLVPAVVFFLLVAVLPATGEQVAPGERVSTYVNVRQSPLAGSPSVGTLRPGQSAELIESIPYWYHIRLSSGIPGYVSKAWTVLVSEDPADASGTGKTDLIIGSWNIKWFGYYSQDKHDYPRMADILQKFDLAAIQELRGSGYKDRLDKIVAELATRGYRYTYAVSQETGYRNNPDAGNAATPKKNYLERYAFVWDIDRLHPVDPATPYRFVSSPRINNPAFRQVPIVGDFKVAGGNGFDFRILTIHTVYNAELNEVRKDEIQFINDWIIGQIQDSADPEKNIIALGDFNANPDGQPHHFDAIVTGTTVYRVLMNEPLAAGEPSLRTTVQQSNNPAPNYFLLPVYDHILVSPQTGPALPHNPMTRRAGDLGIVEFDQSDYWHGYTWNEVIRAMSDHRPVWFRANYNAADLD
jgi:endonuclease/exonuclease/phosphatase family metal-dependent hydrolase